MGRRRLRWLPRGSSPPAWAAGGLQSSALPATHPVLVDFCQSPARLRCPAGASTHTHTHPPPSPSTARGPRPTHQASCPSLAEATAGRGEAQAQASGGSAAASGPSKSRTLGSTLGTCAPACRLGKHGCGASPHGLRHPSSLSVTSSCGCFCIFISGFTSTARTGGLIIAARPSAGAVWWKPPSRRPRAPVVFPQRYPFF